MTTPQEEAKRRYPETQPYYANRRLVSQEVRDQRQAFEEGAEWQAERLGPLVEAARAWLAGDWSELFKISKRLGVAPTWPDGKPRHMWDSVSEYARVGDYETDARYVYPARERLLRVVLAAALDEQAGQ